MSDKVLIEESDLAEEINTLATKISKYPAMDGWVPCDGSILENTKYAMLFKALVHANPSKCYE